MEIPSNHQGRREEEDTRSSKAESEYPPPPGLLRGGAPATAAHRRHFQPIPAPFMSFRPPTANTPMPHHQGQLQFHGRPSPQVGHHGGSSLPPFNPPGSDPRTLHRSTANSVVYRSAVGVYAPRLRRIWKPKSTQMTMFYNGVVNVFNDVPADKAREIMVLASRASVSSSPPSSVRKYDCPIPANTARFPVPTARNIVIQKPQETISHHVSVVSTPIPVVSQAPTLSKSTSVVPPVSQSSLAQPMQQPSTAAAATIRPIAVHQSRKASLARFLERRKERVSGVMPYRLSKSPLESSASSPSKLSRANFPPPSNTCEESMSMGMYNDATLSMSHRVVIELE